MGNELIVFVAFFSLQAVFHGLQHFTHVLDQSKLWERIVHSQVLVLVFHPTVLHTIQDYSIHFVIYSGKIIAAH